MPDLCHQWGSTPVHNFATSGYCAWQVVNNYEFTAHTVKPKPGTQAWLFCWLGINDLMIGQRPEDVHFNLKRLWGASRSEGFKVAAFTITRGGGFTPQNGLLDKWATLNNLILSTPSLYDGLCRPDLLFPCPTNPQYFVDGIHPTTLGARYIAMRITCEMLHCW